MRLVNIESFTVNGRLILDKIVLRTCHSKKFQKRHASMQVQEGNAERGVSNSSRIIKIGPLILPVGSHGRWTMLEMSTSRLSCRTFYIETASNTKYDI